MLETTQDTALIALRDGRSAGYVVTADEMQSGRGRLGNAWQAPKGNLYLSLLLRPAAHHAVGDYALLTAVAVAQAVQTFVRNGVAVQLKWPNDVLVQDQKLSGILIEAQWDGHRCAGLVVGVGINVMNPPSGRAGIAAYTDQTVSVTDVRDAFLAALAIQLQVYEEHGIAPIRDAWLARAWRLHDVIQFRRVAGEAPVTGTFIDLSPSGNLCLRLSDGTITEMTAGEIIQAADEMP